MVVHTHPDGDALGSGAALLSYLRSCRGADARLLLPDTPPDNLAFLLPAEGVIDAARDRTAAEAWLAQAGRRRSRRRCAPAAPPRCW